MFINGIGGVKKETSLVDAFHQCYGDGKNA